MSTTTTPSTTTPPNLPAPDGQPLALWAVYALAGAAGGLSALVVGQPFDTVKVLFLFNEMYEYVGSNSVWERKSSELLEMR